MTRRCLLPLALVPALLALACALPIIQAPPAAAQDAPATAPAAETVRIGTYNIENFMRYFDQIRMPERSRDMDELYDDEEDLYEVARTIGLDRFDPDILGIEECCTQEMLELFNKEWLGGRYAFVKVFPSNVDGQYVGILAKEGFEPLEVRSFADEADPVDDPAVRGIKQREGFGDRNLLFARGPGFVLFRTPGGQRLWVGVTHVKSKYGNSEAVTRWRIREMQRTREICAELLAEGKTDRLLLVGDFNDEFGMDRYEQAVGTDAVAVMAAGDGDQKFLALTAPLLKADPRAVTYTYHCEIKPPQYRSFIDHIFASPAAASLVRDTHVVDDPIAAVASDHYPVVTVLELPR